MREDMKRLHDWLRRVGPTWPITTSIGNLSGLFLKSPEEVAERQEQCRAAINSLNLPASDPMLKYADLFCQVYPQTYFLHLAGKEEVEAYSLRIGLILRQLLGSGITHDADEHTSYPLRYYREAMGSRQRRLSSHGDDSGDFDFQQYKGEWALGGPLEDALSRQSRIDAESDDRRSTSSPRIGEGGFITADDSHSPILDTVEDSSTLQEAGKLSEPFGATTRTTTEAAVSADHLNPRAAEGSGEATQGFANDAAGRHFGESDSTRPIQEAQDEAGVKAAEGAATEPFIVTLREAFEHQAAQHQYLLKTLAAQEEQRSRMQEPQKQTSQLQQEQEHSSRLKGMEEDHNSHTSRHTAGTDLSEPPGALTPHVEKPMEHAAITLPSVFPGINIAHESDTSTKRKLHAQSRHGEGSKSYHGRVAGDGLDSYQVSSMLEERYGSLFLNIAGFLLNETTLEDLIMVAEWHVNPTAHSDLCRERKFALFLLCRDSGELLHFFAVLDLLEILKRFELGRSRLPLGYFTQGALHVCHFTAIIYASFTSSGRFRLAGWPTQPTHHHYDSSLVTYDADAGRETWQQALQGLRQFQRLFRPRI